MTICFHGCPISGDESTQLALNGKDVCISYVGQSYMDLIIEICRTFCLDNGAFSYWTNGKEFDLEGFAAWVTKWYRHPSFTFFCLPDVIDGDENANQIMRARFFNCVDRDVYKKGWPVYHLHEPDFVLEQMVRQVECQVYGGICIGSSGEVSNPGTDKWWKRISEIMPIVTDELGRPKVKLHGLRQLSNTIRSHIPYSSCDSTNVARNVGIDKKWKGTYTPKSKKMRALVMMERIEDHATASIWNAKTCGVEENYELFG